MPDNPAALASVITAIDQTAARIVEITAHQRPSYTVGNRTISWSEYLAQLNDTMSKLIVLRQQLGGPFEVRSRAVI